MAQKPEPDAPKRANVGPRRSAESIGARADVSPDHGADVARSWPRGLDGGSTAEVLSYLFVNTGQFVSAGFFVDKDLGSDDAASDRMLTDLQSLIHDSVTEHGGNEIGSGPDGVMLAFFSPSSAVTAALDIRRAIDTHNWPAQSSPRAGMGLHTGESKTVFGAPSRLDASRAEKIAAVSHPGQVIMSGATATLLADSGLQGVMVSDLGMHRLKDLGQPERLFQVEEDESSPDFPLLRSLDNPVMLHNLPERLSSFVGREHEQAEVLRFVISDRMVTLIGAGGAGKTRLALQVAAELLDGTGDGVWLVELAALSDPQQVEAAIASALGVQPEPGASIHQTLVECLRHQQLLLVLDNCEHLIDASARICHTLLTTCPKIHVLATSREPLGIEGEHVYRIPPLSLPPVGATDLHDFDAVRLFEERARTNQPNFALDDSNLELAVSLCRKLDGIPLALELAAARLRSTSLSQINAHLDDRFRILTGGNRSASPRQQTLLATVEWSYDLLNNEEQTVLKKLSVFSGDFLLETAESLFARTGDDPSEILDTLGSLVDKSLVVFDPAPSFPRYRLLETIRQFGRGNLGRQDGEDSVTALSDAHADVYVELLEDASRHLRGPEQLEWFDRLDIEHDNIRSALGHLLSDSARPESPGIEKAMRIGVALKWFWQIRSHRVEALDMFSRLSERIRPDDTTLLSAKVLNATGEFLLGVNAARAHDCFERSLAIARQHEDGGVAALALSLLGSVADQRGELATERELRNNAIDLARANGNKLILADVLSGPTKNPDYAERLEEAIRYYDEAGDRSGRYIALLDLGAFSLASGRTGVARLHLEAALELGQELGVGQDQTLLVNIAEACLLESDYARAKILYGDAIRIARRHADGRAAQYACMGLALCFSAEGQSELAAKLHGLADAQLRALGYVWAPENQALAETDRIHLSQTMGSERFSAAFAAGEVWDTDDAMKSIAASL